MVEKVFGRIRRSEFDARREEFEKSATRCAIGLKVPPQFADIAETCTPSHDDACGFERVTIDDVYNNHYKVGEENRWELLGCGVGRCAYKWSPKCVIKFARSGKRDGKEIGAGSFDGVTGEQSNMYEVASYTLADDTVKQFLNPIVAHAPMEHQGYKWIVMPLVKTLNDLGRDEARSIMNNVEGGLNEVNAQCSDIHLNNIGLLEDKYPVLIDYGFSLRCKRIGKGKAGAQPRKLSEFIEAPKTKHKGRHGLKRPRGKGIPMGVLTQRRRILWAEAGALRRKAKDAYRYPAPERQQMLQDARFLEQQAWGFQTKLMKDWKPKSGAEMQKLLGLLNQTRKEAFLGAGQ